MKNQSNFVLLILLMILLSLTVLEKANAHVYELPLACEGYYIPEQTWIADFDLGTALIEISNIYIDWSGSIKAEFAEDIVTGERFPMDAQFIADIYDFVTHDICGSAYLRTGAATYPNPEPFDLKSTFINGGWSMLLDGQGTIEIGFWGVSRPMTIITIEDPNGELISATLVIEGIPALQISEPNDGEFLLAGSTYTINWEDYRSDGNCPGSYLLDYSSNNGQNWITLDSNSITDTCSYDWVVPSINSEECLIRVLDATDPNIYDTSDGTFTIYECTLTTDLTGDCMVGFADLATLALDWLKCGNPFDPNCVQ